MQNATAVEIERRLVALPATAAEQDALRLELATHADSLDRLVGSHYYPMKIVSRHPGWTYKNPSICAHPAGGYRCAVRYASWPVVKGFPTHSELVIVTITEQLELTDIKHVQAIERSTAASFFSSFGPEDARLFQVGGNWFASASFADVPECAHNGELLVRIGLMFFDAAFNWTRLSILPGRGPQHEKNWMPIEGSLAWLYSPAATVQCRVSENGREFAYGAPVTTPTVLNRARGGTQIINIDQEHAIGLVHETLLNVPNAKDRYHGYHRAYLHRFVLYRRDPLLAIAVSPPFHFLTPLSVEFAAGLARKQDKLLVSFGHHDTDCWLAEVRLADVRRVLRPVV